MRWLQIKANLFKVMRYLSKVLSAANRLYKLRKKTANDIETAMHTSVRKTRALIRSKVLVPMGVIKVATMRTGNITNVGIINKSNAQRFPFLWSREVPNFKIYVFKEY